MIIFILLFLGLVFGSFINAWVWRTHEQLNTDGEPKKLSKKRQAELSVTKGRSMCPYCKHELSAKDLVPLFSWLYLRGKCRYCKKKISIQYPIIELLTAILFLISYIFWPIEITQIWQWLQYVTMLTAIVGLVALAIYDAKWMLIPDKILFPVTGIVAALVVVQFMLGRPIEQLYGIAGALLVCSGIFWILFQFSNGKWIGGGDVKLGLLTGLLIGTATGGMLYLFFASILGLIWSLILIVQNKKTKGELLTSKVPFGPFLILSCFVVVMFGEAITSWYFGLMSL